MKPRPPDPESKAREYPQPGQSLDEQARRLAARCRNGEEELRAVVLRRAADLLLHRVRGYTPGPGRLEREPREEYAVPARWPRGEDG